MTPYYLKVGLIVVAVLLAGCSGVMPDKNQNTPEQQLRVVMHNDVSTTQTVTLTFSSADGQTVLNKTKTMQPDENWIVSTLNVSTQETPVTVTARIPERNYTNELTPIRGSDRGSRLYTVYDDGINIHECNTNLTCWQN